MTHLGGSSSPVETQIETRTFAGMLIVLVIWAGLLARLFYLQVMEGDRYRVFAERNSVRTLRVEALRGRIFDRTGELLVQSRPSFDVQVIPYQTPSLDQSLERLSVLTGADLDELRRRVGKPRGLHRFRPVVALHDMERDAMARVGERIWAMPGVITDVSPVRAYPGGERAAHVLGKLGEISSTELEARKGQGYRQGDIVGKQGIERLQDRELRGRSGGRNVLVDARGREIEVLDYIAPQPGQDLMLTLDMRLQRIAEDSLDALKKKGSVVAVDPRNGQVLVLASRPAFDPNHFADKVDSKEWGRLIHDERRPLLNRAIQGVYPPGSTYKVVTALAGIERGIITPDFTVHCGGSYRLGRRTYRCWKKEGHGNVDVHKALVRSCDVFFYKVGHMLKPSAKLPSVDVIAFFAKGLGLGMRTGIPLEHEATGLVPTAEWKERVFREKWMDGESISLSIGQGANQWTPMQLAMAYAAIGNGGTRYKPQLVRRVIDPVTHVAADVEPEVVGKVPVSERALQIVRQGLDGVVNETSGTAYWSMKGLAPGIRAAGKTGTAQVINMAEVPTDQEDLPEQYRDHAWFAAFAPVETPRIAIAILVENGGHGGSTSAPIAKALMNAFFENEIKDAQPQLVPVPEGEEPAPLPGTVRGPLLPGGSGAAENTVLPPVPGVLDIPGLPSVPAGPRPPARPARAAGSEQARVQIAPAGEILGRN